MSSDSEEFVPQKKKTLQDYENPLAWGKKKENYYREEESEYSDPEEQEKAADEIYQQQLQEAEDDDYALHQSHKEARDDYDVEEEPATDYSVQLKALRKQIKKTAKIIQENTLLQDIKNITNFIRKGNQCFIGTFLESHKTYLMCLVMLLHMYSQGLPQVDSHPIMEKLSELNELCKTLRKQKKKFEPKIAEYLKAQMEAEQEQMEEEEEQEYDGEGMDEEEQPEDKLREQVSKKKLSKEEKQRNRISNYLDDEEEQQPVQKNGASNSSKKQAPLILDDNFGDDLFDQFGEEEEAEIEEGLKKYNEMAKKNIVQKKLIKKQKRQEFLNSLPSQAFEEIKNNEARAINYTILRNRGLTRQRKNQPRSARTKYRQKFETAQKKQRSKDGKVVYENPGRPYHGESVIKMGKIKSTKIT